MKPVLFELNFNGIPVPVYAYGFFSILSLIFVITLTLVVFRNNKISWGRSLSGTAAIAISTIIGARLFGILSKYPLYNEHLNKIFALKFKDFSLLGGLIFAILAGYIFLKLIKQNTLKISDELVFVVGAGLIVWRVGCFLNACCTGKETDSIFGIYYPGAEYNVHPTQIYEIIAIFIILIILFFIRKRIKKHGTLSFIFYTWFVASYLFISFFREHAVYTMILNTILAIVLWITISAIGFIELRGNKVRY